MNVAILHYHFDRGGVTRVVSSTLDAFRDQPEYRFGILSGRPVTGLDAPTALIPGLNYSTPSITTPTVGELYAEVIESARNLFGGREPDVWHIHNPALGKNSSFCGLIQRLANDGRALLLHEHDFAEDFRPANYRLRESSRKSGEFPFPFSPRIRFAVLNQRDAQLLIQAGLPAEFLSQLPNPVPPAPHTAPLNLESDLILYPVRALARKNLGEFLLLAHSLGSDYRWETTLPPTNAQYQERFRQWTDLADSLNLPVRLGVALQDDRPLEDRLAESRAVVTTSVAEGFGLSFLEPWTYGRPVFGRDLPEITDEFRQHGIPLESLYSTFTVPAGAVDRSEVARRWRNGIESAYSAFTTEPPTEELDAFCESLRTAEQVDFSLLGEDLQAECLRKVIQSKIPIDPPVSPPAPSEDELARIRSRILQTYSPEAYAAQLGNLYQELIEAPSEPPSQVNPDLILREFLHPNRFHPHFVE
ncbi:MAG: glycosyltransferase [Puniceicoccales bacterium]